MDIERAPFQEGLARKNKVRKNTINDIRDTALITFYDCRGNSLYSSQEYSSNIYIKIYNPNIFEKN